MIYLRSDNMPDSQSYQELHCHSHHQTSRTSLHCPHHISHSATADGLKYWLFGNVHYYYY